MPADPDGVPATRLKGSLKMVQIMMQGRGVKPVQPVAGRGDVDFPDGTDDLILIQHGIDLRRGGSFRYSELPDFVNSPESRTGGSVHVNRPPQRITSWDARTSR